MTAADLTEARARHISRVLITEEEIGQRVREMAAAIEGLVDGDQPPLLVGVLTGAVTFMTDLMRAMTIPVNIDFMAVSSYGHETVSSGVVRILKDLDQLLEGRTLVVVEDIVDSGLTLRYLLEVLRGRNPAQILVVALLKKNKPASVDVQCDIVGFEIPDEFVVGYGLDYAGEYRNLPYVAVLTPPIKGE